MIQILDLKEKYPKLVLFVECGYRYRFFGRDAEIAADVLGITCHPDRMFMVASVPTFNGPGNYVRKLVERGHRVGIVSQTETAAEKKQGAASISSKSSRTFERALTAVYSRTTMLGEDISAALSDAMAGDTHRNVKSMIMVINESAEPGGRISLVAVQPTTGEIVYDEFEDDATRRGLEQRLEVIEPLEVIIARAASVASRDVVKIYRDASSVGSIIVEEASAALFAEGEQKLQDLIHADSDGETTKGVVHLLSHLSDAVAACISVLYEYLKQFGMEMAVVTMATAARNMSQGTAANVEGSPANGPAMSAPMNLPAITLKNLEVFQTLAGGNAATGTLYQVMNRTVTKPGARLLKDWISRPLQSVQEITERQEAVTCFIRPDNNLCASVRSALRRIMDLEVALMAAFYKKSKPATFVKLCDAMARVHEMAKKALAQSQSSSCFTPLLTAALQGILESFSKAGDLMLRLDPAAAKEEKWEQLFYDWAFAPEVSEKREEIAALESTLEEHKSVIKRALGLFSFQVMKVTHYTYILSCPRHFISLVRNRVWSGILDRSEAGPVEVRAPGLGAREQHEAGGPLPVPLPRVHPPQAAVRARVPRRRVQGGVARIPRRLRQLQSPRVPGGGQASRRARLPNVVGQGGQGGRVLRAEYVHMGVVQCRL